MADKISLTESVRSNLLALQSTGRSIDQTQTRLSTGLRVNSPLDDAAADLDAGEGKQGFPPCLLSFRCQNELD